jgi:hypothetical protein
MPSDEERTRLIAELEERADELIDQRAEAAETLDAAPVGSARRRDAARWLDSVAAQLGDVEAQLVALEEEREA